MRRNASGIACITLFVALATAPADEDGGTSVTSRITSVTVYADRAQVTREAEARLLQGQTTVAFAGLPGWIDEGSIRFSVQPPDAGRIVDVRVRRDYLAKTGNKEVASAEAAVREIADQVADLEDEKKVLDAHEKQIDATRAFSMEKLPRDMAMREVEVDSYRKVVDYVTGSLRQIAAARRAAERKRRDLQPELDARQRRLAELQQRTQLEQCTVLADVSAPAAVVARLTLTYMLPGATWEPVHELRSTGKDAKRVSVSSFALVSQTTGEDWAGADLSFSTQSSTEPIRIPEIDALLVGGKRSLAQVVLVRHGNDFAVAQSKYAEQNTIWFAAKNPQVDLKYFADNRAEQEVMQERSVTTFRRIQERGTTAQFQSRSRPIIRSDGKAIRAPIGVAELAAQQKVVAAPEVSLNAARTADMTNTSKQPLLPGKVAIYHDGAFLGMTDVDFTADGESFAVFLGVADQIKLSRTLDRRKSAMVRGKRTRLQVAFEIGVENLSEGPATLSLADRVPVSGDREVDVRSVRVGPTGEPDSKGLIKWEVNLAPRERKSFNVEYTLEYPADWLERNKAQTQGGVPAPAVDSSLMKQIQVLESKF